MAKKIVAGGIISPTQLWGKPLKAVGPTKPEKEKASRKMTDDDVMEDEEIDVDAELANADEADDAELHAVEAETDSDVTDEIENGGEPEDEEPDYDAEEGDVSDENEDVVEDGEEVVTAVADDSDESEDADNALETTGKGSMSEKMSLSDHVRAEIARRQKSGDSLRGKDILASLEKRKITVSAAQVSQLLKKAGLGGQPRGKKAATPVAAGEKSRAAHKGAKRDVEAVKPSKPAPKAAAKGRPAANGFNVPMEQLSAASNFVDACGGSFEKAQRILAAAEQLSASFGG